MTAAPAAFSGGRREQDVWFKFTQVDCVADQATTAAPIDPNSASNPHPRYATLGEHPLQRNRSYSRGDGFYSSYGTTDGSSMKCRARSQYWENYWFEHLLLFASVLLFVFVFVFRFCFRLPNRYSLRSTHSSCIPPR
jgi:hypothetical protein